MTYTTDQMGHMVRQTGFALFTLDDKEEIANWISDIIREAAGDDSKHIAMLLEAIQDILD